MGMTGMWPIIGLAAMMLAGFASLVIGGVVVVHVGYRWWLMISCGMDWDDAGTLIHAKARRRHGAHVADKPASWPQAGWQDIGAADDDPGQAYKAGPALTERLAAIAADAQYPGISQMVTPATGRPPWEDHTQIVPAVGNPWLREGGGLDQTIHLPAVTDESQRD
jgi:hypothetical protein